MPTPPQKKSDTRKQMTKVARYSVTSKGKSKKATSQTPPLPKNSKQRRTGHNNSGKLLPLSSPTLHPTKSCPPQPCASSSAFKPHPAKTQQATTPACHWYHGRQAQGEQTLCSFASVARSATTRAGVLPPRLCRAPGLSQTGCCTCCQCCLRTAACLSETLHSACGRQQQETVCCCAPLQSQEDPVAAPAQPAPPHPAQAPFQKPGTSFCLQNRCPPAGPRFPPQNCTAATCLSWLWTAACDTETLVGCTLCHTQKKFKRQLKKEK